MANNFQPLGFEAIRNKGPRGGGAFNDYPILFSDTSILGIGDLVRLSSGYVTKAGPTHTPLGIFQGWNYRTRSMIGGSYGGSSDGQIPWRKMWRGAVVVPTGQQIVALLDDDPNLTFRVQASQALAATDIGKLVDMVDSPGGPNLAFERSRQSISYPTTYYNITAYSVDNGGSGYTQDQVDLVINGVIQNIRPSDIVVTAGVIISITPLNQVQGLPTNTPTSTVQPKPGYAGSGAVVTTTKSSGQTAAQFRLERPLEQPLRQFDSGNNTVGYDLSTAGLYSMWEVSYAKHARGSVVATG